MPRVLRWQRTVAFTRERFLDLNQFHSRVLNLKAADLTGTTLNNANLQLANLEGIFLVNTRHRLKQIKYPAKHKYI